MRQEFLPMSLKIPDFLGTVERFGKIAVLDPTLKDLALEAAAAYDFLYDCALKTVLSIAAPGGISSLRV